MKVTIAIFTLIGIFGAATDLNTVEGSRKEQEVVDEPENIAGKY